jgi:predicted P-loop ATPase
MFQAKLGRYLLVFFDELDAYAKREGLVKAIITQEIIKIRPLYSKFDQNYVRIASFIGAINHESFLNDQTGNRRFLAVEVKDINHTHNVDMDKVFCQAFALARDDKFVHYFTKEETLELEERNDQFRAKSDEELIITQYFETCKKDCEESRYFTTTQVITHINNYSEHKINCSLKRLGILLKQLGFERANHGTGKDKRVTWLMKEKEL